MINTPLDLVKALEELHGVPLWRHSWCLPADASPDGKKDYCNTERPALTADQIASTFKSKSGKDQPGRGFENKPFWIKPDDPAYRCVSVYLKFVRDLFVIDFDSKDKCDVEKNDFYDFCMQSKTIYTETAKGYHFYFYIDDVPDFTCSTKVEGDKDYGEVDILGRKNVPGSFNCIEAEHHKVFNGSSITDIACLDWDEIKEFLNTKRMQGTDNKENDGLTKKEKNEAKAIVGDTASSLPQDKFIQYIDKLEKSGNKRYNYDMFINVGIICWNNFENKDTGFSIWMAWAHKDPMYPANPDGSPNDHSYRNLAKLTTTWDGFKERETKLTWKTLRKYANEDVPSNNIYQEVYDQSGVKGMCEYMNGFMCFNTKTTEIIFVNPNDNSRYAETSYHTPANCPHIFDKWQVWIPKDPDDPDSKKKKYNPFKIWMTETYRRDVDGVCFDATPCPPPRYFNLFEGFDIDKRDLEDLDLQTAQEQCGHLITHIYEIWCHSNDLHYKYMMDWFAHILQRPYVKVGVLVTAKSKEGGGKGIVFDFMRKILGGRLYAQVSSMEQIIGTHNSVLEGRLLINGDEVIWGGNIKDGNTLKGLITEPEVWIHEKYRARYRINSTTAFCFSSNEERSSSAREGDRRSFGLELLNTWCGRQKTPEHKLYFSDISGNANSSMGIARDKAEGFAKCLFERDLTGFNPANPPITEFITDAMQRNWFPVHKFWFKVLSTGAFSIEDKFKKRTARYVETEYGQKTDWEEYDNDQLVWGSVSAQWQNGFKDIKDVFVKTERPLVGYAYYQHSQGCSTSLKNLWNKCCKRWFEEHSQGGIDFPVREEKPENWWAGIPVPSGFCEAYRQRCEDNEMNRNHEIDDLYDSEFWQIPAKINGTKKEFKTGYGRGSKMGKSLRFTNERGEIVVPNILPNDVKNGEKGVGEKWHFNKDNSFVHWDFQDNNFLASGWDSVEERGQMECDHEEGRGAECNDGERWIDQTHKHYLRKMDFSEVFHWGDLPVAQGLGANATNKRKADWSLENLEIKDVGRFQDYLDKWKDGVNRGNWQYDLVSRPFYDKDGAQVFHHSHKEKVERWVYDKDWVFEKYTQSVGSGYGADNVDFGSFWKSISEMLGGEYKKGEGGKYRSIRLKRSGCDRKQYFNFVSVGVAREKFEEWAGRLVSWEDKAEGDDEFDQADFQ